MIILYYACIRTEFRYTPIPVRPRRFYIRFHPVSLSSPHSFARDKFLSAISNVQEEHHDFTISVHDVIEAVQKQKKGKAAGLDGIHMKAYTYGGCRLFVHISILFNLFVKYCYLPKNFMSSVIVPLAKCI